LHSQGMRCHRLLYCWDVSADELLRMSVRYDSFKPRVARITCCGLVMPQCRRMLVVKRYQTWLLDVEGTDLSECGARDGVHGSESSPCMIRRSSVHPIQRWLGMSNRRVNGVKTAVVVIASPVVARAGIVFGEMLMVSNMNVVMC